MWSWFQLAGLSAAFVYAWRESPCFRSNVCGAAAKAAWGAAKVYTAAEKAAWQAVECGLVRWGWDETRGGKIETVTVGAGNLERLLFLKRFRTSPGSGGVSVALGTDRDDVIERASDARHPGQAATVCAPTIRIQRLSGPVERVPVEFGNIKYTVPGNRLFDRDFVELWLTVLGRDPLGPRDAWVTSFLGPGMVPVEVPQGQWIECTEQGFEVKGKEPECTSEGSSPGEGKTREKWMLDLGPPEQV